MGRRNEAFGGVQQRFGGGVVGVQRARLTAPVGEHDARLRAAFRRANEAAIAPTAPRGRGAVGLRGIRGISARLRTFGAARSASTSRRS